MFTVKQLSELAGITARTLHHYDAIGLLKPSRVGENGYRYYGEDDKLRLQQILFYRELNLPLDDIKKIISRRDFDVIEALQSHKDALNKQAVRLKRLIQTVDDTIDYLKGNKTMDEKALFDGFTGEDEKKYTDEAIQSFGKETVQASAEKWKVYTAAEKKQIGVEGDAAYKAILASIPRGPESPEAQSGIERWRRHIEYFWTPNDEQLIGLAEIYNVDSRFKTRFDKIDTRLAEFMRAAVKIYVQNRKK